MAGKKYYWLKLKRDFFKRHDVRIIEEMPNGKDYILFYLKMLLESIDHEGELRFSKTIPYNEQMLSVITNTNIDIVKSAMKIFIELRMVEIFDDSTIYMSEVQRLIGSETAGAERVRKHREKKKALPTSKPNEMLLCNNDETKCNTEIEKDIDIKKDNREKSKSIDYLHIKDMYNEICISFPRLTVLSEKRKQSIKARLKTYTIEQFEEMFKKAEESTFLKGSNNRDWQANFDWFMKDGNFAKVLDGNYDNKKGGKNNSSSNFTAYDLEAYERMINEKDKCQYVDDDPELKAEAEKLKKELAEKY